MRRGGADGERILFGVSAFARALLLCALIGTLCRVREEICTAERLFWERFHLIDEQGQLIREMAEARAKLRYLETRDGKELLARSFGYINDGETLVQPLGVEPLDNVARLEELPANVDEELGLLLSELQTQLGDKALRLPVPTVQALKRFERVERTRHERVNKWLSKVAGILWVGATQ